MYKSISLFRDVFSYFPLFYILLFYFILCSYSYSWGIVWGGALMSTSSKCQFSIPTILGAKIRYFKEVDYEYTHFEGDPTISKIGNVPLQNIQRMGPHPKPLWIHHPIIIFSNTDFKLQSTLLHQRFICYWHIELVDVVEIYIAPTFHIILQSL